MSTIEMRASGEVQPPKKSNLQDIFPKKKRPYRSQNRSDPWVIFRLWIPKHQVGYIGRAKDRGNDRETLVPVIEGMFYAAKRMSRAELANSPAHAHMAKLADMSEIKGEILCRCSSARESIEMRKHYILKHNPTMNRPGYIKPYAMA